MQRRTPAQKQMKHYSAHSQKVIMDVLELGGGKPIGVSPEVAKRLFALGFAVEVSTNHKYHRGELTVVHIFVTLTPHATEYYHSVKSADANA